VHLFIGEVVIGQTESDIVQYQVQELGLGKISVCAADVRQNGVEVLTSQSALKDEPTDLVLKGSCGP
jgi:hypothetical protein